MVIHTHKRKIVKLAIILISCIFLISLVLLILFRPLVFALPDSRGDWQFQKITISNNTVYFKTVQWGGVFQNPASQIRLSIYKSKKPYPDDYVFPGALMFAQSEPDVLHLYVNRMPSQVPSKFHKHLKVQIHLINDSRWEAFTAYASQKGLIPIKTEYLYPFDKQ